MRSARRDRCRRPPRSSTVDEQLEQLRAGLEVLAAGGDARGRGLPVRRVVRAARELGITQDDARAGLALVVRLAAERAAVKSRHRRSEEASRTSVAAPPVRAVSAPVSMYVGAWCWAWIDEASGAKAFAPTQREADERAAEDRAGLVERGLLEHAVHRRGGRISSPVRERLS